MANKASDDAEIAAKMAENIKGNRAKISEQGGEYDEFDDAYAALTALRHA